MGISLDTLEITNQQPDIDTMTTGKWMSSIFFLEVAFSFLFYKLKRTGGEEELQIFQNGCDVLDLLSYSCFCPFHKLVFLTLLLWKKK